MDYVTGLARKVKGETQITSPDVGLSPGSRNATDFVSLFHKIKNFTSKFFCQKNHLA